QIVWIFHHNKFGHAHNFHHTFGRPGAIRDKTKRCQRAIRAIRGSKNSHSTPRAPSLRQKASDDLDRARGVPQHCLSCAREEQPRKTPQCVAAAHRQVGPPLRGELAYPPPRASRTNFDCGVPSSFAQWSSCSFYVAQRAFEPSLLDGRSCGEWEWREHVKQTERGPSWPGTAGGLCWDFPFPGFHPINSN